MTNSRKASDALSGKTARACDGCLVKRARWFCAADDAFLCQVCDASVHSANNLASRHERVRLQSCSPLPKSVTASNEELSPPAWHGGFTRKARTPRSSQKSNNCKQNSRKLLVQDSDVQERMFVNNPLALVPEIGCEDDGSYMMGEFESEEQMICRVPVFDPFLNEDESSPRVVDVNYGEEIFGTCDDDELGLDVLPAGFLPSDVDLAEFAADAENLLGLDYEEDYFNSDGAVQEMVCGDGVRVKDEVQDAADEGLNEMSRSGSLILDWNLELDGAVKEEGMGGSSVSLRLNYDAVISAWDNQGSSPWTTGSRPDLNPHYWSHCSLGTWPKDGGPYGGGGLGPVGGKGDGEREARVLRYKEKRRTRLFSKKIRYQVRKLNAEKRPRMKGRFVKRTPPSSSFGTSPFPSYLTTK